MIVELIVVKLLVALSLTFPASSPKINHYDGQLNLALAPDFNMFKILCCIAVSLLSIKSKASQDFSFFEQSLQSSESKYTDIVQGTEKQIRWYGNLKSKTKYAIIYLHGFSASRMELSPTTEILADKIGANVFYTRLKGHGRSDDAMAEATLDAWKKDALEAYRIGSQIGETVIIISASTGGTLSTWLQHQAEVKNIAANIMISPNFGVKSSSASILLWPGGLTLAKWISGDYRSFTPANEKHALYWTERYPIEAVVPMLELVSEVNDLNKFQFKVPQFIIYSPTDQVVDVEKIENTIKEFDSEIVSVYPFETSDDPAQHVLSGDACAPNSTKKMVNILENYIKNGFSRSAASDSSL